MNPTSATLFTACCVALLCSCNTVRHNRSHVQSSSTAVTATATDSVAFRSFWSADKVAIDTTHITSNQHSAFVHTQAEFYPTPNATGPVTITTSKTGDTIYIDPGGNQLKSITHKKKDKAASAVTQSGLSETVKQARRADSVSVQKTATDSTTKAKTETVKNKSSFRLPLPVILMVIVGLVFVGIAYKNRDQFYKL